MNKVASVMTALAVFCLFASVASAQLDIGGDIKVMAVYTDNVMSFDDDFKYDNSNDFLRVETTIFFKADLSDNVTTKVSIGADRDFDYSVERVYDSSSLYIDNDDYYYEYVGQSSSGAFGDLNIFLREAWIQMAYLYDSAFNVKLGRQYIQFGDGFIIGDSQPFTPLFLSDLGEYKVDPFDAALVWYDGDDWVLNMLYSKTVETRGFDQDADLYALYFTYSGIEDYVFDLYFTFNRMQNTPYGEIAGLFDAGGMYSFGEVDAKVYNIGARVAGSAFDGLTYKLEGTYQFGDIEFDRSGDMDVRAWAIEAGLKYMFDAEYNPYIGATYVFMSGDDGKSSSKMKNYLPLFANRTYGEIFDPWTNYGNMHIFNLAGGFDLNEDIALGAKYYYFLAHKDWYYGEGSRSDNLGHELDVYLDYQFSRETKAVLASGFFVPEKAVKEVYGDDAAWFVRAGVKVEF